MTYIENRVTTKFYGTLARDSSLLVTVPSSSSREQRLHVCAARGFTLLSDAIKADLNINAVVASGWRPHRWTSFKEYTEFVTKKYGSLQEGRKYLAFDSPHETGLAVDFGCGGLSPTSSTIEQQRQTPLFKWLVENAWKYGWTPYKVEPWHWEYHIEKEAFEIGSDDFISESGQKAETLPMCSNDETGMCIEAPHDWASLV